LAGRAAHLEAVRRMRSAGSPTRSDTHEAGTRLLLDIIRRAAGTGFPGDV